MQAYCCCNCDKPKQVSPGKRIILLRHGEEPKQKKIDKIQTEIGLNEQGAIRASLMPEIIEKLIGKEPFELHTYTHTVDDKPTARSFYTAQLIEKKVLYPKSSDIDQLIENIKKSEAKIIIVCWEHKEQINIMKKLIDVDVDWNKIADKIYKKLGKKYTLKSKQTIELKDITMTYCSEHYIEHNTKVRDYIIKPKDDISYGLVWDIDFDNKSYKVYPNYLIKKKGAVYKVFKYI
jgi:hypothetical protein